MQFQNAYESAVERNGAAAAYGCVCAGDVRVTTVVAFVGHVGGGDGSVHCWARVSSSIRWKTYYHSLVVVCGGRLQKHRS